MNSPASIQLHLPGIQLWRSILTMGGSVLLLLGIAHANPRSSTSYTITAEIADGGGIRGTSAAYTSDGSAGAVVGLATGAAPAETINSGYIGQLYEARSLVLTATPDAVVESLTTQLTGVATMDDGTRVLLSGSDPSWAVLDGAITGITANGVATAGEVFLNAPATVQGAWDGIASVLSITVLNSNVALPGDTVPDPLFSSQNFSALDVGHYQGLLKDSGHVVIGALTGLNVLGNRAFTGKVVFNGVTYSLAGSFLADGSFTGQILRPGKTAIAVALQLGTALGAPVVRAVITGDGTTGSGLIAQAALYTKLSPAPAALVKSYTFSLPSPVTGNAALPGGDGYGTVKVSSLGVITAAGKTGDGIAFTTTGALTPATQWQLFQSLYSGKGQLAGVLSFRDVTNVSDLDGVVHWVKNPNLSDKSYKAGFVLDPTFVGGIYTPPLAGHRALTLLANQFYNARLTLAGTVLANGGLAKVLTWLSTNTLVYYGPETLSATTTTTTGIVAGSYFDPALNLKVPFAGAVLQKQGLASGNFLLNNIAGYLLVEPGTSFPHPGSESAGPLALLAVPVAPATSPIVAPVNFASAAAGSFAGILNNGAEISGGLDSLVVNSTGALTGSVIIEGRRYTFTGGVGSDGRAFVVILRPGMPSIIGDMQLSLANGTVDGFQLTGKFSADGVDHIVDAQRNQVFTKTLPAPQAGKYTLAMTAPSGVDTALEPGGDGYASLTMDYTGANTGTLTLADGTTTTFSGRVSRKGEWSLVRSLYSKGFLAGKLTFRDVIGVSDLDGQCHWVKPNAVPKTLTYPAGFNVIRPLIGSHYTAPAASHRAFASLSNTFYNAWLRFSGPDMSTQPLLILTSVDRAATWNTANKILYYGPDKATITFAPTTGLATGSYVDTPNGVSIPFGGALLQKQALLTGRYTASGRTGLFSIAKR